MSSISARLPIITASIIIAAAALTGCGSSNTVTEGAKPAETNTAETVEETQAEVGTRDNPAAIGSTIASDDWTVVVNSFTADGNQVVADAFEYNDPAAAGSHYSLVNYTITYTGDESGLGAEVSVALVTNTGEVLNSYDSIVILSDSFGMDELYNGGTATGSAAFTVPDGAEVLIRVTPGVLADDTFVTP